MKLQSANRTFCRNDFAFLNSFFGIHPTENDIRDAIIFSRVFKMKKSGGTTGMISKCLKVSERKIEHWISGENKPFIIKMKDIYSILGKPDGNTKWLSLNSTKGGTLTGPWIKVPQKIETCNDIDKVIKQIEPTSDFLKWNNMMGTNMKRIDMFAFLLGVFIGDLSKYRINRKRIINRRITLRLSKRHKTNEDFGNFVAACSNAIGLRMKRCKDCPAGKRNPSPFYTWISQSSLLFQWIFCTCLGLESKCKTTYDAIKADWILKAPKEFRICFLQGLAESDGFVDITSFQIGIITEPNTKLIKMILLSLGIESTKRFFQHSRLWALMLNVNKSYNLPIFNQFLRSYRYQKMEKIFFAKRINGHWPNWICEEVYKLSKMGLSGTKLSEKIIDEYGILIRAQRINRKIKEKDMKEMRVLGIESTAL